MHYENWPEKDLEDLDTKFDALCEYLNVEFIFERVSDGSDIADRERVYVRSRVKGEPQPPESTPAVESVPEIKSEEPKIYEDVDYVVPRSQKRKKGENW